jgi:hypothetical protein
MPLFLNRVNTVFYERKTCIVKMPQDEVRGRFREKIYIDPPFGMRHRRNGPKTHEIGRKSPAVAECPHEDVRKISWAFNETRACRRTK